jgi:bifunctional non-homologous end joining protein LigD
VSCVVKRTNFPEMPGFIKPQLATLRSKAPAGDQWLHEIKYDGYRIQLHRNRGKPKAYTRTGLDWTKRFSVILGPFDIPGQAVIDGEVVVVHEGLTNFSELQADLARGDQDRLLYYAFDLLWFDGKDLRKTPQIERKDMLQCSSTPTSSKHRWFTASTSKVTPAALRAWG